MQPDKFSFRRSRGLVWVCDLAESSKYLNENSTANELENFLPRLHWLSRVVVEAAGGTFLKWTGDGFLAWFELPLHRELSQKAQSLFNAIWHLTFTVNVTQLSTSPSKKFHLRHGVAFEQDALLTTISHSEGHESLDITGRSVVLAFRLSGIRAEFPNLVSDATIARAAKDGGYGHIHFKSWSPGSDELLRYFKGEKWGTRGLVISTKRPERKKGIQSAVKKAKKVISSLEPENLRSLPDEDFVVQFSKAMMQGPQWARDVQSEESRFLKDDMLGTLKKLTTLASELATKPKRNQQGSE